MRKNLILPSLAAPFILSGAYASANTLTRLIPDLYAGLDVVSRELIGFIPSVMRNASAERAAVGQSVVYWITEDSELVDTVPAMVTPEPTDKAPANDVIQITKSKNTNFGWTGEEQRGLNTGPGYLSIQADYFAQGLRKLANAIEIDLATEAMLNASRAYGTAGTTPFGTNHGETAQVRKILDDNGAPLSERSLVIDTSAGAALRTLSNLTKVNEAGTQMTLRDGELLNLNGLSIKESAGVQQFTAGTGASSTTNAAGYAIGATVITLASAGTGVIKAGDVITFAGDANKYVVKSGDTDVSNGGTITLAKPGLRRAIPAAATAITIVASHTANIGFVRSALHLVARAPALPQEGDSAIDRIQITDPRSGLVFEVSLYAGYRKIRAEVAMAWGVKAVKPEHIAMLLG
ncbi:putative coat protein [Rhizobium phage vB_RglS_P106B]|uniref:Putative coat protein n=1 Tax=Rhizobium phage vB_RglS_P106B TaxID=1458697 RepID=W6EBZ8_9CAUD|nr:major head protein [Rhizobium phage vB_RglS_P106B]AHJ10692.1 putative coat protein [Rhizobium phage vB_RglS_P106B]